MKKILLLLLIAVLTAACNAGQGTATSTPSPADPPPAAATEPAATGDSTPEHTPDDFDPLIEFVTKDSDEVDIIQNMENVLLHNTYFGVSYVMPETWFFWHLDENNLNADPAATEKLSTMTIDTDPTTNESFIDFFEIGSCFDESDNDHLSVGARAIFLDGRSMDEYFELYKNFNTRSEYVSVVFDGTMELNEVQYRRLIFFIEHPTESYDNRIVDTFSIERNGYCIMVRFDGWASCPDNEQELMTFMMFYVHV